jgi:hypothetical protein
MRTTSTKYLVSEKPIIYSLKTKTFTEHTENVKKIEISLNGSLIKRRVYPKSDGKLNFFLAKTQV